jgi:protein-tyrosine phosphatase
VDYRLAVYLGGYETVDGRQVKWGEVFRSGRLPDLSDADVDRLGSLGVRTVVNFLTPAEIEHPGEDRLPVDHETPHVWSTTR